MRIVLPLAALLAFAAAAPAFSQTSVAPQKKTSDYSELAKAPEKARAKANPLERDPDSIPAGANLFDQHCAECHGERAEGRKKGPSLRVPQVQSAPPGALFWLISNGVVRRGMPVWSKLPEPQRWQLVAFIKSLGVAPSSPENAAVQISPALRAIRSPSPTSLHFSPQPAVVAAVCDRCSCRGAALLRPWYPGAYKLHF